MTPQEIDAWFEGAQDCKDGLAHKRKSSWYDHGYSSEYESQQMHTELTRVQNEIFRVSK